MTCKFCGQKCVARTVYVIGESENPPSVKVGYAKNASKRLAQIRKSTGRNVKILHSQRIACEFKAMDIESWAHAALNHYWHLGEWFTCNAQIAAEAVDEAVAKLGRKGVRQ